MITVPLNHVPLGRWLEENDLDGCLATQLEETLQPFVGNLNTPDIRDHIRCLVSHWLGHQYQMGHVRKPPPPLTVLQDQDDPRNVFIFAIEGT